LGYENNGLGEWAKRLKKDFLHHNALDDAKMCADIFKHLINLEKETGHVTTISESKPKQTRKLHSKRTNKTEDGSELNLKGLQLTTF
jgi:DNA polymerase III epsilon subunit-like protein